MMISFLWHIVIITVIRNSAYEQALGDILTYMERKETVCSRPGVSDWLKKSIRDGNWILFYVDLFVFTCKEKRRESKSEMRMATLPFYCGLNFASC